MRTKLFLAVVISVLFVSCSNDDDNTEVNDGRVIFTSGVNANQTRVGGVNGDLWHIEDPIGIYMVENGTTTVAEGATNVNYIAQTGGEKATTFAPVGKVIYYPVDDTKTVDFFAYHPHSTTVADYVYSVNTTNQTNQSAIDLMRSQIVDNDGAGYDKSNALNAIALVFNHKLTKVIFNVTPGDGLTDADLEKIDVTIKGLKTNASYDISTDAMTVADGTAPILTCPTTKGKTYEAIVVPQVFANDVVTVEFKLNSDVFVYEVPGKIFGAAQKHIYNVKVLRNRVLVSGTIEAWEPMGEVTGVAQ